MISGHSEPRVAKVLPLRTDCYREKLDTASVMAWEGLTPQTKSTRLWLT